MKRRTFLKSIGGFFAAVLTLLGLGKPRHIVPLAHAQDRTIKWGSCIEVGGGLECRDYYKDTRSDAPCKSVCFEVEVRKTTTKSPSNSSDCVTGC